MTKIKFFVIDTNTLISAFLLSQNSIAAQAYYKARLAGKLVLSESTFAKLLPYLFVINLIAIFL
jgi:hypothetical protein